MIFLIARGGVKVLVDPHLSETLQAMGEWYLHHGQFYHHNHGRLHAAVCRLNSIPVPSPIVLKNGDHLDARLSNICLTDLDRVMKFVARRDNGCWEFTGAKLTTGYGSIRIRGEHHLVHRLVFEQTNGPIPDGMFVCHSCDNPSCCNPSHLWLGSAADNNWDKVSKGRAPKPNAKLTQKQVADIRSSDKSCTELAKNLQVSVATVSMVRNHRIWK